MTFSVFLYNDYGLLTIPTNDLAPIIFHIWHFLMACCIDVYMTLHSKLSNFETSVSGFGVVVMICSNSCVSSVF